MALVQLPTVDDAITALVQLHNYQLSETSHLRSGRVRRSLGKGSKIPPQKIRGFVH